MSTLHQLRSERIKSELPIVKVVEQGDGCKIIGIALGKNIDLKDHKTKLESRLIVLEGKVEYKEENRSFTLHEFDEIDIPVGEMHMLSAKEDSLCLLIQKK